LRERGVGFGDRVILYLGRKSAHILAYLGAMAVGAIPVHLYPERARSYVDFAARAVDAGLVVTLDPWAEEGAPYRVVAYPEALDAHAALPERHHNPTAYLMFTSGTTSTPKAVITTQANIVAVARVILQLSGVRARDREAIFMPLGSTGGCGHLHATILRGGEALLLPWYFSDIGAAEIEALLDLVADRAVDGFLATPGLVIRMLRHHRERLREVGGSLRFMLANVTPMRQEVILDLLSVVPGLRFGTYYGLTEASRTAINVCNESPGAEHATGFPAPGVEIRILDADPETGAGEVLTRGANLFAGYWGQVTPPFDREGWFATGDLGRVDDDGRLWVSGRIRDTINVDGAKCMPIQIERLLEDDPRVAEAAVVALPDPVTYHRVGAAITLRDAQLSDAARAELLDALLDRCRAQLGAALTPSSIRMVSALPRTDLGKLRRDVLAERLLGASVGEGEP
jgi:long-chain acyl-CoA synthetase